MIPNLVTELTALTERAAPEHPVTVKLRNRPGAPVDAVLYLRAGGVSEAETRERLVAALHDADWITGVQPRKGTLGVSFRDEPVEAWADALARGDFPVVAPERGFAGRHVGVQFLDPNLSKALHVGHLWSIALGEAFSSVFEAAGARVIRRLWFADAGRNMFEAVAGVLAAAGDPPELPPGMKPDRFVGRCYAEYVGRTELRTPPADASPIDRELARFGDQAEELMMRWFSGDPAVREHWRRVRAWALEGQEATLGRIGVRFDEPMYQSDALADMEWLVDEGLRRGLLHREDDGRIVYRSSREEFDAITLVRHDGFPTEYARLVAMIWRDQPIVPEYHAFVAVSGDEWGPPFLLIDELLGRLGPYPLLDKLTVFYHGMLTLEGAKMKSRDGRAVLLDDLLDGLVEDRRLRALAPRGNRDFFDLLANVAARIFFLARQPNKNVGFDPDLIADDRRNPGWSVCKALCRLRWPDGSAGAVPREVVAGARRLLVVRAMEVESRGFYAAQHHDPRSLTKFLLHTAEACLGLPLDPGLAAAGRGLIETLLGSIGLPIGRRAA